MYMPADLYDYPFARAGSTRRRVYTRKTGLRIVFGFNASVNNGNNLFTSGTCSSECSRLSMAVSMNHSA